MTQLVSKKIGATPSSGFLVKARKVLMNHTTQIYSFSDETLGYPNESVINDDITPETERETNTITLYAILYREY